MNLIGLFITSVLAENVVLTKFLGMCPFFGVSKDKEGSFGMGLAVMLVITLSSLVTYFLYNYVLVPSDTEYLNSFIYSCYNSFVQLFDIIIKKNFKSLHNSLGLFTLVSTNCAVLGVVLLNIQSSYTLEVLTYSIGSSFGFIL